MERERFEEMLAGVQNPFANAEPGNQPPKKIAAIESENKQLKTAIAANEYEINRLKETIDELDFENRILKTKNAAIESQNNHLEAEIKRFDTIKAGLLKSESEVDKISPGNTGSSSHVLPETTYVKNQINKRGNVRGWISIVIVLLITALVLFLVNMAYKI